MSDSGIFNFFLPKAVKMMALRILLVDDHAILLYGITNLLEKADGLHVSATSESAEKALEFIKTYDFYIVISDFLMPGMDGLTLVHTIKRIQPEIKTIILSMHDETHLVTEILRAGVNGYVLKKDTHKELLNAIDEVKHGRVYLSSDIDRKSTRLNSSHL